MFWWIRNIWAHSLRIPNIFSFTQYHIVYFIFIHSMVRNYQLPLCRRRLLRYMVASFFIFTTVNIATGKAAKQSSTVGSAEAGLATDGNYEATTATDMCAVTESEGSPWWRVDLARTYDVARVDVSGCSDCNSTSTVYLLLAGIRQTTIEYKTEGRNRIYI